MVIQNQDYRLEVERVLQMLRVAMLGPEQRLARLNGYTESTSTFTIGYFELQSGGRGVRVFRVMIGGPTAFSGTRVCTDVNLSMLNSQILDVYGGLVPLANLGLGPTTIVALPIRDNCPEGPFHFWLEWELQNVPQGMRGVVSIAMRNDALSRLFHRERVIRFMDCLAHEVAIHDLHLTTADGFRIADYLTRKFSGDEVVDATRVYPLGDCVWLCFREGQDREVFCDVQCYHTPITWDTTALQNQLRLHYDPYLFTRPR